METLYIKVDEKNPEIDKIRIAAEIIKKGGLVAFPTETVYGLGANALDEKAAIKIFEAKKRPQDNPLIVHIQDIKELYLLVKEVPQKAYSLIEKFWPGPLTLIFEKSERVPNGTTGGLDTVAVRMPDHRVARLLIRESGVPIAAPSANLSGKPSPTNAQDVMEDMKGRIDAVIDGGDSKFGVESTVLDLTGDIPIILRPGGITKEELEEVLGRVQVEDAISGIEKPKSPGMKYRHYSPKAEIYLIVGEIPLQIKKIKELAKEFERKGFKVGILATAQTRKEYFGENVISAGDRDAPLTISSNLFSLLRKFDRMGVDVILAEGIPETGLGLAVMNRLKRASGNRIIKA
ncbi:MAG: L-threonylcarbamoyladenylate synthase [Thermovenabulum sp.]|uniref:L-threonylcarbamoyladenylate synthase n=1 Tax=Thermovenabulum sp. TaxID=3100335 RepID=UPI003C7D0A53